jgi:alanine-synthesizing transaminase
VPVGPGVDFMESLMTAAEKAEHRPRGLVVNFPGNPTTAIATPELFQKIVKFAEARDLFILSDCAYCDIVFDGGKAPFMLQVPGARERTLEFVSMSKSYNMAGFRVGFAAGNHALVSALARVKSYLDYGLFGGSQVAATTSRPRCAPSTGAVVMRSCATSGRPAGPSPAPRPACSPGPRSRIS